MRKVNVAGCDLDRTLERSGFRCAGSELTERLGASVIGAGVYEIQVGDKRGPYHYHHGVEEWLYVVSGAPILRDADGERALQPGDLVAFASGPRGAHTAHGPGRIVMFSTGVRGWGEAFVSVYPDSDKISAAPGVMFRRADALESWHETASATSEPIDEIRAQASAQPSPLVNVMSIAADPPPVGARRHAPRVRRTRLGERLGARTWGATLYELAPDEATAAYHYEWCREEWLLVVSGAPTLRHPDGEDALQAGDVVCFPQGPTGAHGLLNRSEGLVRLVMFSTPRGRPVSAFYPDDDTVTIRPSEHEGFTFRLSDQIDDYWDGEPGGRAAGPSSSSR